MTPAPPFLITKLIFSPKTKRDLYNALTKALSQSEFDFYVIEMFFCRIIIDNIKTDNTKNQIIKKLIVILNYLWSCKDWAIWLLQEP